MWGDDDDDDDDDDEEDAIGAGSWDRESKFLQTRKGGSLQTRGSEISSST